MRIGIITMHKPINFGSALQAYALQHTIERLGHSAEIIDYQYPNKIHQINESKIKKYIKNVIHFINCAALGFPNYRQLLRYRKYWKEKYHLSALSYKSRDEIINNPPDYDIYVTGSDQVWNSSFTKNDDTFLLGFVKDKDKRKVSYSSSLTLDYIPDKYQYLFREYLPKYQMISVREATGVKLVHDMSGKKAELVCDPTLLLTKSDWQLFAKGAHKYIKGPYILVYLLAYSFNPFPEVDNIVKAVQKELGKKIIFLDAGRRDYFKPNSKVVKDAGPQEFIELFLNADFVITTSFHGTAFSINFNKPFLSVIKTNNPDNRILSLLETTGLLDHAISYNADSITIDTVINEPSKSKLEELRSKSLSYLKKCLC